MLQLSVIFDMDGVLFDTEKLAIEGWQFAGVETGCLISAELANECCGLNNEDTKCVLSKALGDQFEYEKCCALRHQYVERYIQKHGIPLKQGVIEVLSSLREQMVLIGLATSSPKKLVNEYLQISGLTSFFDVYVCGEDVQYKKPSCDVYLEASRRLNVDPIRCIAIEDSYVGVQAAKNAGMFVVLVLDVLPYSEKFEAYTDVRAVSLVDVIEIVKERKKNECNSFQKL